MGEIFNSNTLSQEGPETWADVESRADHTLIAAADGASLMVVAGMCNLNELRLRIK